MINYPTKAGLPNPEEEVKAQSRRSHRRLHTKTPLSTARSFKISKLLGVCLVLCSILSSLQPISGAKSNAKPEKRVVCYYTNWSAYRQGPAKFLPDNINPYLCTHLIYAFGGLTSDTGIKPFDKYQDIDKGEFKLLFPGVMHRFGFCF